MAFAGKCLIPYPHPCILSSLTITTALWRSHFTQQDTNLQSLIDQGHAARLGDDQVNVSHLREKENKGKMGA